ncbi:MAG: hypothetical protein ACTSVM_05075 [Candidatus Ranarchaeia archaeon]
MVRKTSFKFEGTNPSTGKKFKIILDGWIPDSLISAVKEEIENVLMGESVDSSEVFNEKFVDMDSLTIKHKIEIIILQNFRHGWFNTKDLIEQYEMRFHEKLKKTTAATNLQRLFKDEEILERKGSRSRYEYRIVIEKAQSKMKKLSKAIFMD